MTLEEKIKLIEESESFAAVPAEAMPSSHKENYYFVSYSHKDYKEVFPDILRLEEMGINIWYDNEMHIGENWREIAQMYISKFQCIGVIFYLTEHSITSPACNQEVQYVLTHNKQFLSINKPLDGAPLQSGEGMLRTLVERGFSADESLLCGFAEAFSDDVLYLDLNAPIGEKARQINAIEQEPLLTFTTGLGYGGKSGFAVASCRDNTILSLDLSKRFLHDGEERLVERIDDCVFTNSIKLGRVKLPAAPMEIGDNAFRNCASLTEVLFEGEELSVGKHAFQDCAALTGLDLARVCSIGDFAFWGCTALSVPALYGSVGVRAFHGVPLRRVEYLSKAPHTLARCAFLGHKTLEEFSIKHPFAGSLREMAFEGCEQLRLVGPFVASFTPVRGEPFYRVGSSCFERCVRLEEIRFEGAWELGEASRLFARCEKLRMIDLNITGKTLPDYFAEGCRSLSTVTNAEHFEHIGVSAFEKCSSLRDFNMVGVRTLGESAFAESGIERAYLKNVTALPKDAFAECSALRYAVLGEDCLSIEGGAFFACKALTTLKILSPRVEISRRRDVFSQTDIKVVYLRSAEVLSALVEEGVLAGLAQLYLGEELDASSFDLSAFTPVESDEAGFVKLVQSGVELPLEEVDIDVTGEEINEPLPNGKNYPIDQSGHLLDRRNYSHILGYEWEIKHARIVTPQTYFVEEVTPDGDVGIERLTVSMHTGKRFSLPGNLIRSMRRLTYQREELHLFLDTPKELDGRPCAIAKGGETLFVTVVRTRVRQGIGSSPLREPDGRYLAEALFYREGDVLCAVSAKDVTSITVFDERFRPSKTILPE